MGNSKKMINGVGVLFYTKDTNRNLYLLRNQKEQVWGIPGGKVERGETLLDALERECREEVGFWPENAKLYPIECFTPNDGKFSYHTFYCAIDHEFIPRLNDEHLAYSWCDDGIIPRPLHGGLYNTLNYDTVRQKISIIRNNLK
jgi:8-oxo-dGTP pyrophosphatase MutT (NUDIX family)